MPRLVGVEEWSRRRLQAALVVGVLITVAVVAGLVWLVLGTLGTLGGGRAGAAKGHSDRLTPKSKNSSASSPSAVTQALPGPLSNRHVGSIVVPQPTSLGPAEVGTGFPQTPEGALGQLIAIDERALDTASVVVAQDVITAWAAPAGPTPGTWSGVAAVSELLEASGLPGNGSSDLTVQLEPSMGAVRQPIIADPTVCVDFIVTATLDGSGNGNTNGSTNGGPLRVATADCQNMTWQADRWVIAPGPEAPAMPSIWPGTQASYEAGYQWLEIQP